MSGPNPPPKRRVGMRQKTETFQPIFLSLVGPIYIYFHKEIKLITYTYKTTTVVVFIIFSTYIRVSFTCSYTISLLQNSTFTIQKQIQNLHVVDFYSCVGLAICGISRTSSSIPTRINTRAKLYSLVGVHKYGRPL